MFTNMVSLKLIAPLVAFFVVSCQGVAIDTEISDMHNIDQCDPTTVTLPLLERNVYVPEELFSYVMMNLTYPEDNPNTHIITCLKVINVDTSSNGGYPEIISGGVGYSDVLIQLSSQWSQPLNFRIEIWADE